MSSTTQVFNITPNTRAFQNLGSTGEPAWKAIAELIDNSVDARTGNERVTVEILYKASRGRIRSIVIEDDAAGMSVEQLVNAFKIGLSNKRHSSQIGFFGMGMKTAIASLGSCWTITTATADSNVAYQINQDLNEFVNTNDWTITVNTVPKTFEQGTRIEIENCDINAIAFERDITREITESGKVKEISRLGDIFKHFLLDGTLTLLVNGNPLPIEEANTIENSVQVVNRIVNGKHVRGWLGLRTYGSSEYGISLIRYNRVIADNVKLGFQPDQHYNRVIGELHLDEFATNHHKTNFITTNDDWEELRKAVAEDLQPVLRLARELSNRDKRRIDPKVDKLINESVKSLLDVIKSDDLLKEITRIKKPSGTPWDGVERRKESREESHQQEERNYKPRDNRKTIPVDELNLRHVFVCDGEEALRRRWEVINGVLNVYTNADHPVMQLPGSQHSWAVQNILEAMAAYYATEANKIEGETQPSMEKYEALMDRMYRLSAKANIIF